MCPGGCLDAGLKSALGATYPFHTCGGFAPGCLELFAPIVDTSMALQAVFVPNSSYRDKYSAWSLPSCPEKFAEGSAGGPCDVHA